MHPDLSLTRFVELGLFIGGKIIFWFYPDGGGNDVDIGVVDAP
jgi:hypothetical protein